MFAILSILGFTSGCQIKQEAKVPDLELCFELTRDAAFCKTTNSQLEREVPAEVWIEARKQRVSLSTEDYQKLVGFIDKACDALKCSDEKKKAIQSFYIESVIDGQAN